MVSTDFRYFRFPQNQVLFELYLIVGTSVVWGNRWKGHFLLIILLFQRSSCQLDQIAGDHVLSQKLVRLSLVFVFRYKRIHISNRCNTATDAFPILNLVVFLSDLSSNGSGSTPVPPHSELTVA